MVRILIVEDQRIMQKYFESIIMREPEFRHVQTVSDACEAVKICSYSAIDLVLMDVQTFHNHDGLSAGKIIREKYPYTKVLVVTSLIDPRVLERAKSGCADSLWYKDHGEEEIRSVIYRTLNGEHVFPDVAPEVFPLPRECPTNTTTAIWQATGCHIPRSQGKWTALLQG